MAVTTTLHLRTDTRFTVFTMGTAVSVSSPQPISDAHVAAARERFRALDERFSLYQPDSEATAVASRRVSLREASAEYRAAYDLAHDWSLAPEGASTPHRPDGRIDLAGVVKALGIQAAADALDDLDAFCINAGGDILVKGWERPDDAKPWVAGIVDPTDRHRLISQFACSSAHPAVCTSGIAERGDHVWRLAADSTFTQVTVAGPDLVTADVLATAILAGGPATFSLATQRWPIEVLAFRADGRPQLTQAFRA